MNKSILTKSILGFGFIGGVITTAVLATSCGKPANDDTFNIKVGDTVSAIHLDNLPLVKENLKYENYSTDRDIPYFISLDDANIDICCIYHFEKNGSVGYYEIGIMKDITYANEDFFAVVSDNFWNAFADSAQTYAAWDQASLTVTLTTPTKVSQLPSVNHNPLNYLTFN